MNKLELISPVCLCLGAFCFFTASIFLFLSSVPVIGTALLSIGVTSLACTVILVRSYVKSNSSLQDIDNTYLEEIESEAQTKLQEKVYRRELRKLAKAKK